MPDEPTPDAHRRAAARLRALADRLAAHELSAPEVLRVDEALAGLVAELDDPPETTRYARLMGAALAAGLDAERSRDVQNGHPLAEGSSGIYPVVHMELDLPRLVAEVDFSPAFEGPPGLVHGGFLAAGFDMAMSALALQVLDHSVTRHLRLRYLAPTFLGGAVRFELEAAEVTGRTVDIAGRLVDATGRTTMRGSGQFASMGLDRFVDRPRPT